MRTTSPLSDHRWQPYTNSIETADEIFDYLLVPAHNLRPGARRLVRAAAALGRSRQADLLRVDVCHRLRRGQDHIFAASGDPCDGYSKLLDSVAAYLESAGILPVHQNATDFTVNAESAPDETASHYGKLWGKFSSAQYFDEAFRLIEQRFIRNKIDVEQFKGKRALDCGCGGGRYTVALKRLGFADVVGCDWSDEALALARLRADQSHIDGVTYIRGDALDLPFENDEFDFVFSNGVLHHTQNTLTGLHELLRVMKREGTGWLYLYARPGGLDRLTHYLARLLLRSTDREVSRRYCRALGLQGNRALFLLELWLSPIVEAYTPEEMEMMLQDAGASNWRRMTRGSDADLVEHLHRKVPYAEVKYGVGENRYFISGKASRTDSHRASANNVER